MQLKRSALAALFVSLSAPAVVHAQDGFSLNTATLSPTLSGGFFHVERPETLSHFAYEAGISAGYAHAPLVVIYGDDEDPIVGSQTLLDVRGAIGLFDLVEIGFGVPFFVAQPAPELRDDVSYPEPTADVTGGAGLGDVRLQLRGRFITLPMGLSVGGALHTALPTGDQANFQGGGFALEPRVTASYTMGDMVFGANVGYRVQEDGVSGGYESGDQLAWGAAAMVPVGPISAVAEVTGRAALGADYFGVEEAPAEWMIGARHWYNESLGIQLGLGRGLTSGVGTPSARALLSVAYQVVPDPDRDGDGLLNVVDMCPDAAEDLDEFEDIDGCPELDNDEDGVLDDADLCPLAAEDVDGFEDADGCPELDNDEDGIDDELDLCRDDAEDLDGFEDSDGCPELDNDGDGVEDAVDACRDLAEDADGFQDEDGCPEVDNDGDGFLDDVDSCRDEAEVINGVADTDGCPDESLIVVDLTTREITYSSPIGFAPRGAELTPESAQVLDLIAAAMLTRFELQVDIEVRTNERSQPDENLPLSQERAQAVMNYLTGAGVAAGRVGAQGLGMPEAPTEEPTTTVVFRVR